MCTQCPPQPPRYFSATGLRQHLASAAHRRASGPGESSNSRARPEPQQSTRTDVNRTANVSTRRRVVPPVDLAQWAQSINQTLAGSRPAAFSTVMLLEINNDLNETQCLPPPPRCGITLHANLTVLVLSPTKVVVTQIYTVLSGICEPLNMRCYACIGGTSVADDQSALADRPHVVTGTPGRVADLIRRHHLRTKHIKILVLNMDSKLLSPSFQVDVHRVHSALPQGVQIIRTAFSGPRTRERK